MKSERIIIMKWEETSKKIDSLNDQLDHAKENKFKLSMIHTLEVELAKYSGIMDGLAFAYNS